MIIRRLFIFHARRIEQNVARDEDSGYHVAQTRKKLASCAPKRLFTAVSLASPR